MKLYSLRILQAHLKATQVNAKPMLLKEFAKPTYRKRKLKKCHTAEQDLQNLTDRGARVVTAGLRDSRFGG